MILDLFAGPGGWSEGLRSIGLHDVGIEWDAAACQTRAAAGHLTIRADVAAYPVEPFVGRVRGLIASPPCQAWSMAGKGAGRKEIEHIHRAVEACRNGWVADEHPWEDERTRLILEPLRWAWALRPLWIACEQVPPGMPVWEHMADVLRSWGYDATAVELNAADYGVPQTRRRAFLLAHRDRVRVPEPTHAEKPEPDLFGPARKPWVTMAQALGWERGIVRTSFGEPHRGKDVGSPKPEFDSTEQPSRTICSKTGDWRLNPSTSDTQPNRRLYGPDEPAPTVGFSHDASNWKLVHDRPSTTLVGSFSPDVVAAPGYRTAGDGPRQNAPGSVRITVQEAAVLQGFRPDYPWQGSKSKQFEQCGNVVCPPVAAAIVGALDADYIREHARRAA